MPAAEDLENIKTYLQLHNPHFAEPTVRTIYQRVLSLKTSAHRGRPGHVTGTRELVLSPLPYPVVYRVKDDSIEILHIYHAAQDWQSDASSI
jgi:plasmid stabilization system protein ParE